MRLLILVCTFWTLIFTATPSFAQEAEAPAVTDTDGDGVEDSSDACPQDAGPVDPENPRKSGCTSKVLARQWIVAFISRNAPPGRKTYFKYASETKEEALQRYNQIADDLVAVVYAPDTVPMFKGPNGRARTAALILGVSFWETGFRRDVDLGLGPHARGDKGRSWCLMQLNIGTGKTPTGFSGPDLIQDRRLCFAEGLRVIRGSFSACRRLPLEHRLSAYASGSCARGRDKSSQRVRTGMSWFSNSANLRPFVDVDVMAEEDEPKGVEPLMASVP